MKRSGELEMCCASKTTTTTETEKSQTISTSPSIGKQPIECTNAHAEQWESKHSSVLLLGSILISGQSNPSEYVLQSQSTCLMKRS